VNFVFNIVLASDVIAAEEERKKGGEVGFSFGYR